MEQERITSEQGTPASMGCYSCISSQTSNEMGQQLTQVLNSEGTGVWQAVIRSNLPWPGKCSVPEMKQFSHFSQWCQSMILRSHVCVVLKLLNICAAHYMYQWRSFLSKSTRLGFRVSLLHLNGVVPGSFSYATLKRASFHCSCGLGSCHKTSSLGKLLRICHITVTAVW